MSKPDRIKGKKKAILINMANHMRAIKKVHENYQGIHKEILIAQVKLNHRVTLDAIHSTPAHLFREDGRVDRRRLKRHNRNINHKKVFTIRSFCPTI